ncbi:hypothetical protein V5O48_018104 [Marasmius crinis-equi]|uniref:Uncharacterized protein n=1 Tax=Marasmius crinis-equi TaxID=585013 RepID=A0ABR3EM37_9AGAR
MVVDPRAPSRQGNRDESRSDTDGCPIPTGNTRVQTVSNDNTPVQQSLIEPEPNDASDSGTETDTEADSESDENTAVFTAPDPTPASGTTQTPPTRVPLFEIPPYTVYERDLVAFIRNRNAQLIETYDQLALRNRALRNDNERLRMQVQNYKQKYIFYYAATKTCLGHMEDKGVGCPMAANGMPLLDPQYVHIPM